MVPTHIFKDPYYSKTFWSANLMTITLFPICSKGPYSPHKIIDDHQMIGPDKSNDH